LPGTLDELEQMAVTPPQAARRVSIGIAEDEQVAVREEVGIADEFGKLLAWEGWTGELTAHGKVKAIAEKWAKLDLHAFVKERFNFDFDGQQRHLRDRLDALRTQLAKPTVPVLELRAPKHPRRSSN
jgi:hypothetical protein